MLYYYMVGYSCYDDVGYLTLSHEKHFSQEEYEQMIFEISEEVIKEEKETEKKYPSRDFSDLYGTVAEKLVEKHGFSKIEYNKSFMADGSSSLFVDEHATSDEYQEHPEWHKSEDYEIDRLRNFLRSKGYSAKDDHRIMRKIGRGHYTETEIERLMK